ncbi:hypothetical protein HWV62_8213 [Athelia sp. TMB]|nr:hypothetical protein HWV62_8213 [Athelia sp. TMB]
MGKRSPKEEELTILKPEPINNVTEKLFANNATLTTTVESLMEEEYISSCLGQTIELFSEDINELKLKVKEYTHPDASDPAANFEVLSTGVTLVDLPGFGDANATRDKLADGYIEKVDGVILVAPINRALDEKVSSWISPKIMITDIALIQSVRRYVKNIMMQMIIDGRSVDDSCLVLTKTDTRIGDDEVEFSGESAQQMQCLKSKGLELGKAINAIERSSYPPEQQSKYQGWMDSLKQQQSENSSNQNIIKTDGSVDPQDILIFDVASMDYLAFVNLLSQPPAIFRNKTELENDEA